ncbi:MAG: hypothetical protein WCS87_12175 [Methylococcaceae bacterium]
MTKQDIEQTVDTETLKDNYDSPWKEAVEHYFPEAYAEIDWIKEYLFLDQE